MMLKLSVSLENALPLYLAETLNTCLFNNRMINCVDKSHFRHQNKKKKQQQQQHLTIESS